METTRWARGAVISACAATCIMLVAITACAGAPASRPDSDPTFHLLDSDADFERLGLDRIAIAPWEDGRRTPLSASYYEWWYFDGLLDDGTVIVVWLGDNWPYGSGTRNVSLEITPPGGVTRKFFKAYMEPGSYAKEMADTRFGPHSFVGDLATYRIRVDAAESGGLGVDLTLARDVGSYRPATGYAAAGDRFFAWLVAVPNGTLSGSITMDGTTRGVGGSGYHDHNWGNVSPSDLMDSWWWGRAVVGKRTVIAAELHAKRDKGGARLPLYFVGTSRDVEVDAYGADVEVELGPSVRHPDPRHKTAVASSITFAARNGIVATFPVSDRVLTSMNPLQNSGWRLKAMAALAGMKPWYTRFLSPVTLSVPGGEIEAGEGTLELIEFK